MTNHENIIVSAIRYALPRRTCIVDPIINYIKTYLKAQKGACSLFNLFLTVAIDDIENCKEFGSLNTKKEWKTLLVDLKKVQKELSGHKAGPDDILVIEVKKITHVVEDITKEQVRKYLSNDRKKEV